MVVADTSVWIPFFNEPESEEKRALDALIDADRLVMVGVVLAELIQGCRTASTSSGTSPVKPSPGILRMTLARSNPGGSGRAR